MMSEKISYKTIASRLDAHKMTEVALKGELFDGMTLLVKERLTLPEMSALITDVVNTVIDMKTGEYNPEFTQLIKMMLQLKHYAGIRIGKNDLAAAYRVIYETDLYDQFLEHVDTWQVETAMEMADERIKYMRELLVASASSQTLRLLSQMEMMMDKFGSMKDSINGEDLQKMLTALTELSGGMELAQDVPANLLAAG